MFEKIHNTSFRLIVVQILTFGIRHSFEDIPRCVGYPFECCPGYMWNYNSNVCERKSSLNKLNLFPANQISSDSEII